MICIPISFRRDFKVTTGFEDDALPINSIISAEYYYERKARLIYAKKKGEWVNGLGRDATRTSPLPFDPEQVGMKILESWDDDGCCWSEPYYTPIKRWITKNVPELNGRSLWNKGVELYYLVTDGEKVGTVRRCVGLENAYGESLLYNKKFGLNEYGFNGWQRILGGIQDDPTPDDMFPHDSPEGLYQSKGVWFTVYEVMDKEGHHPSMEKTCRESDTLIFRFVWCGSDGIRKCEVLFDNAYCGRIHTTIWNRKQGIGFTDPCNGHIHHWFSGSAKSTEDIRERIQYTLDAMPEIWR